MANLTCAPACWMRLMNASAVLHEVVMSSKSTTFLPASFSSSIWTYWSVFSAEACGEDAVLTTDLGLSSVGMLYLVIAIEESFGILFENVTMGDFVTLRDVVDYLEEKTK